MSTTDEQLKVVMKTLVAETIEAVMARMDEKQKADDEGQHERGRGSGGRADKVERKLLDEKFRKRVKEFAGTQSA